MGPPKPLDHYLIHSAHNGEIKVYSLGGIGEVGGNCFIFETPSEAIIIDCGMRFNRMVEAHRGNHPHELSEDERSFPDFSVIQPIAHKVIAVCITHGHLDHLEGHKALYRELLPYRPTLYTGRFTAKLITQSYRRTRKACPQIVTFENDYQEIRLGKSGTVKLTAFTAAHSIPDTKCFGFTYTTLIGVVWKMLFMSDHKCIFSSQQRETEEIFWRSVAQFKHANLLITDTLYAHREEPGKSEDVIASQFEKILDYRDRHNIDNKTNPLGTVIVTCFASNITRIANMRNIVCDRGGSFDYRGRSLDTMLTIAKELKLFPGTCVGAPEKPSVTVVTGSQGEAYSHLMRVRFRETVFPQLQKNSMVVFFSNVIPGNEPYVTDLILWLCNEGCPRGTVTISDEAYKRIEHLLSPAGRPANLFVDPDLHHSGHAAQAEIKQLLAAVAPQLVIPYHFDPIQTEAVENLLLASGVSYHIYSPLCPA